MRDWLNDTWSYSKFAYWLRNVPFNHPDPKVYAEANSNSMLHHPFRYWLSTIAIDTLQDILSMPIDFFNNIKYYINNRWITKTHILSSSHLKVGQWHELDDRILYTVMDSFVEFCLNELLYSTDTSYKTKEEKLLEFFNTTRLQSNSDDKYAEVIQEFETIYSWWTTIRPLREYVYVNSSYYETIERYDKEDDEMLLRLIKIRSNLWS